MPTRKPKTKMYCCPKCNKIYKGIKWMQKHLVQKNHGITFLTFYSYDTVKDMEYRLAQLEHKMSNLNLHNIVVKSSDIAIERIKQEAKNPEKKESQMNFTVVIQQLNIVFKSVTPGEHNIKPSEVLKNIKN